NPKRENSPVSRRTAIKKPEGSDFICQDNPLSFASLSKHEKTTTYSGTNPIRPRKATTLSSPSISRCVRTKKNRSSSSSSKKSRTPKRSPSSQANKTKPPLIAT